LGIIGLSPSNLISPIDFVPGLGPANKFRKAHRAYRAAKKSGYLGSKVNNAKKWLWATSGSLEALSEFYIYRSAYRNRDSVRGALDLVMEHEPIVIGGGPLIHRLRGELG